MDLCSPQKLLSSYLFFLVGGVCWESDLGADSRTQSCSVSRCWMLNVGLGVMIQCSPALVHQDRLIPNICQGAIWCVIISPAKNKPLWPWRRSLVSAVPDCRTGRAWLLPISIHQRDLNIWVKTLLKPLLSQCVLSDHFIIKHVIMSSGEDGAQGLRPYLLSSVFATSFPTKTTAPPRGCFMNTGAP